MPLLAKTFPTACRCVRADSDPYVEAGVYARVVVKPYKIVLP